MNLQIQTFAPELTATILLVEDDRDIAEMLAETLQQNGYAAATAQSGAEMDRLLRRQSFDLIVLDVMLPGEDGFSICRRLRAEARTPIIMLTAVATDVDRIVGLEFGADDYVTKPFNTRELLARIRSLLRRASYGSERPERAGAMTFAGWRIDPVARTLVDEAGSQVFMTTAEFDLLVALCLNAGRVLTREQLLSLTHAGVAGPVERSVDVHISRIRQKLEPNPKDPSLIKTVRLGGYLFTPMVEPS
ncbi:two-component system OmpR family response regulator [Methylopila capsulata]|uniref:Regulatory protein VirG n=1 Tax=Methylopila capsulata TaxID=61654 RepID=A0A9W6MQP6_9HYPH|nr:response regulator transcription factor [Methylopila capsulata]MBM7851421.1 two-component system OmpR family response regulator [Methylopila capsulata]GLK54478.1 DNA-binding response regulator [Methylopila capsulata]